MDNGYTYRGISEKLGFTASTIHAEVKRGKVDGQYDPCYSFQKSKSLREKSGREPILCKNSELASYISQLILNEGLTVPEVLDRLNSENSKFSHKLNSVNTIYRAIDYGLIPGVTRDDLALRTTKMSDEGMVCIPKWLRTKFNLKAGDVFSVDVSTDGQIILKRKSE